jgi:hypothetical protein
MIVSRINGRCIEWLALGANGRIGKRDKDSKWAKADWSTAAWLSHGSEPNQTRQQPRANILDREPSNEQHGQSAELLTEKVEHK